LFSGAEFRHVFKTRFLNGSVPDKYTPSILTRLAAANDPAISNYFRNLHRWFGRLGDSDRKTMFTRLHDAANEQHLSAFYELFFQEYCYRKGWAPAKDPRFYGHKPDFLVTAGDTKFLLEAFTICGKETHRLSRKTFHKLLRELDKIESKYLLAVHMDEWCQDIEITPMATFIENWLDSLDSGKVTHQLDVDEFGFKGRIIATEQDLFDAKLGSVNEWTNPAVEHGDKFLNTLKVKSKNYEFVKNLNIPFVLFACFQDNMDIDELDICSRLFGSFDQTVTRFERSIQVVGSERRFYAPSRQTRVSAVIVCVRRWREGQAEYDMRVMHNPWAKVPLAENLFHEHAQLVPDKIDPSLLRWTNCRNRAFVFR
jgi:hypothetical protein